MWFMPSASVAGGRVAGVEDDDDDDEAEDEEKGVDEGEGRKECGDFK